MIRGGADVIIIEIKCTINVMCLNHPPTIPILKPHLWKNCLSQNQALVPKRLGTAMLEDKGAKSMNPQL